jgi:hypothetical protein
MTEARRIPMGSTIYVDGQPFVLRDVQDINVSETKHASRFGSPYLGLTDPMPGGTGPSVPMKVTDMQPGDGLHAGPVYWVSYLRAESLLPRRSHYPTPGLPNRRRRNHTQRAGAASTQ